MKALRIALGAWAAAMAAAPALAGEVDLDQYYFVRPYVAVGASTIDGLLENGPTSASQHFTSSYSSSVDLAEGAIRTYLDTSGVGAFAQTTGVFGDTLNFTGGDGSLVDFNFDFDGIINASARDPNLNSTLQYGVSATLYVFDASSGAKWDNYTSIGGALVAQSVFVNFLNREDEAIDEFLTRSLSGSVAVSGDQSFKVFASLGTFAALNNNPGFVTMDFTHTGKIGVQAAPGVTYTSASGVFLAGGVPEPATWAVMIMGFGLAGGALRRRRFATT